MMTIIDATNGNEGRVACDTVPQVSASLGLCVGERLDAEGGLGVLWTELMKFECFDGAPSQ